MKNGDWGLEDTFEIGQLLEYYGEFLRSLVVTNGADLEQTVKFTVEHASKLYNSTLADQLGVGTTAETRKKVATIVSPMFINIHNCQHLLIEPFQLNRGMVYDVIVRSRPDLIITKPFEYTAQLDPNTVYFPASKSETGNYVVEGLNGFPDCVFYGTAMTMRFLAETSVYMWSTLPFHTGHVLWPENFLFFVIVEVLGLNTERVDGEVSLFRDCKCDDDPKYRFEKHTWQNASDDTHCGFKYDLYSQYAWA
jgi:hypothetical protein